MTAKNEVVKTEDNAVAVIEAEPQGTGEITKIAEVHGDKVLVTAQHPAHMQVCNEKLIDWCTKKASELEEDANELQAAHDHAKKNKWKTGPLKRQANISRKRVQFYLKIKSALEAGYCIVPNFPVELFAVRTKRNRPLRMETKYDSDHEQKMETNPEGEGEWVSDVPIQYERTEYGTDKEGKSTEKPIYFAGEHDEVDFPLTMAKPQIMEATTTAMRNKIFDGLGILPGQQRGRRGDPMICGMIKDPRSQGWQQRQVMFVVAWHLNTDDL